MADLKAIGHSFTVFSFGVPSDAVVTALADQAGLVDNWEVIAPVTESGDVIKSIANSNGALLPHVHFNPYRTDVEAFSTSHGLRVDERGGVESLLALDRAREVIQGVVFGVAWNESAMSAIRYARQSVDGFGVTAIVHLEFARDAAHPDHELDDLNRLAEAVTAAVAFPEVDVFVDNLTDIDRGYFFRHGLVDRLYNPNKGSHVVRHLHTALAPGCGLSESRMIAGGSATVLQVAGMPAVLFLPDCKTSVACLPAGTQAINNSGEGRWIDLVNGDIVDVRWTRESATRGYDIVLDEPMTCGGPALLLIS